MVVTTDPELDDSNLLVRYLLHSTDVVTEGLIIGGKVKLSARRPWLRSDAQDTYLFPKTPITQDLHECRYLTLGDTSRFGRSAVHANPERLASRTRAEPDDSQSAF